MAFHEVRLPEDVERGAVGGPRFKTTVVALSSGFERRNKDWENTRGKWDIGYGISTKSDLDGVIDFFYVRNGMAHGFRFKDWSDFQVGLLTDDTTRQTIGTGDTVETVFQFFKRYSSGAFNHDRTLTKLVSGKVKVFLDAVEQVSGFTLDLNLGTVTFDVAPGGGVLVGIITEFDVSVRFDTDDLNINAEVFSDELKGAIPQIDVIEIRV